MIPILLAVALAVAPSDPETGVAGGDLDSLLAYAAVHHPALLAADASHAAATSRTRAAGSLPDPLFAWGEMLESVETRVGPQERILSLKQPLPWPGTLGARGDAAAPLAAVAVADHRLMAVAVTAAVRRAWIRAGWLGEARGVIEQQLGLVRSLEVAVRSGYEAGQGRYGDLLQAQIEMARLEDRLRSLDDETLSARAQLNAAVGRDPDASLDLPSSLPSALAPAAPDTAPHPLLAALDHRAESARHEATAARRAGLPGFALGVDWIQVGEARDPTIPDSGKDAVVARVGVTVPLWRGKHGGAADAAEARAREFEARRRARDLSLRARLTAAEVAVRDAERRRALHAEVLLPRARQAYDTVLAAYRAEGVGFAEVLAAQRTLLDLEETLIDTRRDLLLAETDRDETGGRVPAATIATRRTGP